MADCFIIMPISTPVPYLTQYNDDKDHFSHVLEHLFIPAAKQAGFNPIPPIAEGSEVIHAKIIRNLEAADLVLCDMSCLNPNVFFELGIRTALDRPMCLVQDDVSEQVPFDTNLINCHRYKSNLSPWILADEVPNLTTHLKKSTPAEGDHNSLWRYFGLSSRAHALEQPGKSDDVEFLALQIEALRKQIEEQRADAIPAAERPKFGEIIYQARFHRGLSQADLADLAGVSTVTVSSVENGRVQPSPTTVRRLCEALGLRRDEIHF